jgi:hypothetical protein
MDELDMLRAVRDDLAAPSGDSKVTARQALLARIEASREPPRQSSRLALMRMPWRSHPLGLGTWMRLATAIALVVVLLVVGAPWRTREQGSADAAALLNDLAVVAAAQPASQASAAGYRYTKIESMYQMMMALRGGDIIAALVPRIREMWIAADGSGRIRERAGDVLFQSERGRAAWVAAGAPPLDRAINMDFGPGGLSYEDLARLPTDPVALVAVIRERAARTQVPIDDEMFVVIGDLLRQQGAPPAVRAALYKIAAGIPGVELIGDARDHAGRQGVAVAKTSTYTGLRQRNVLIFDPRTSALLGEEHVLLQSVSWIDAPPPVVVGYAVYLESTTVESLPRE